VESRCGSLGNNYYYEYAYAYAIELSVAGTTGTKIESSPDPRC